jgi:hypothetical protein
MSVVRWSDAELREFVLAAPRLDRGEEITADVARAAFREQFVARSVATIQRRMLARVGSLTAAEGIAVFACDLLENSSWDPRRDWLLMSPAPWAALEEWVGDEAITISRRAMRGRKKDAAILAGIEDASSRPELE